MQFIANAYGLRYTEPMLRTLMALCLVAACDGADPGETGEDGHDDDGHDHGETELITAVTVTFTAGGDTITATFSDPDGDGGMSGTADPLTLAADTEYTVAVSFLNAFEDPAEDVTEEIRAEAEDHLVLFESDALTYTYGDVESDYGDNAEGDDLPVGLAGTAMTAGAATGELRVVLRHLPPVNDMPQKVAGLPEMFAAGDPLPGDADADVTFPVEVQ